MSAVRLFEWTNWDKVWNLEESSQGLEQHQGIVDRRVSPVTFHRRHYNTIAN
jgi:hypothetical protein